MSINNSSNQYIVKKTASAAATIDFTDLPIYFSYFRIVISGLQPATDGSDLWIRTSPNTGSSPAFDSGVSDYGWTWSLTNDAAASAVGGNAADTKIQMQTGMGNAANEIGASTIELYNPTATQFCHIIHATSGTNGSGVLRSSVGSGRRRAAAAVRAVRFMFNSGNIAIGSFTLYGFY